VTQSDPPPPERADWLHHFREDGYLAVEHTLFPPQRCESAITLAREFFALPIADKRALAIEGSPHFRGYSEMRNERDWREQMHFGREEPPVDEGPAYQRLRGPNRWPADPRWRREFLQFMQDLEIAGRDVLNAIGFRALLQADESAYLLLKLIHYHGSDCRRPGVAPHVDFSWITLLIQDSQGGLQMRTPRGEWRDATPQPGLLYVNIGELLEFATGGYLRATPHRVITSSAPRTSIPFFLNPALDTWIEPPSLETHVHRVLQTPPAERFRFGDAEWKRKGLGVWCADCVSDERDSSADPRKNAG
jgi:isopenicillin N synthase-like dioxygenase